MKTFKRYKFSNAVKTKCFCEMAKINKRIGVRAFAKQVGISPATFSRVSNGSIPDVETFFKLCKWMNKHSNEFYNY